MTSEHHLGDLAAVGYLGNGIEAATARASQNAVYWYMSLLTKDVPAGARNPEAILDRHTAAFDSPFRAIAAATRPDDMRFDELFSRDAIGEWGAGRVTLARRCGAPDAAAHRAGRRASARGRSRAGPCSGGRRRRRTGAASVRTRPLQAHATAGGHGSADRAHHNYDEPRGAVAPHGGGSAASRSPARQHRTRARSRSAPRAPARSDCLTARDVVCPPPCEPDNRRLLHSHPATRLMRTRRLACDLTR